MSEKPVCKHVKTYLAWNVYLTENVKKNDVSLIKSYLNMTNVKIKPLADRVLVQPMEAESKTASGLIIPDTAKEKPQKGTVVAAGPGTKDEEMQVKVGDVVLYGKYAGSELNVDGTDYLMMRQSDILAVI
jgi:chaperonin GroES